MRRIVDKLSFSHLRKSFAQLRHSFISSNNPTSSTPKLLSTFNLQLSTIILSAILLLTSCGPDKNHIKLEGHLLNLNQAEFFVYSPDGAIEGIDTIYMTGGRFSLEPRCDHDGTLIILLPNHHEIPVFVTPGNSYSISGDAHNMKNIKVKGESDANSQALKDIYEIRRQYLDIQNPDYHSASRKLAEAVKKYPDNTPLKVLQAEVMALMNASAGSTVPSYSVQDINGATITSSSMSRGLTLYISQASWDFSSTSQLNRIITMSKEPGKHWNIIILSFDPQRVACLHSIPRDNSSFHIIHDGTMAQSPLAKKLAVAQTGVVIVTENGKIKERTKTGEELLQYLKNL